MILLTILKWIGLAFAAAILLLGLLLFVAMFAAVIVMTMKGEYPEKDNEMTDGDNEA